MTSFDWTFFAVCWSLPLLCIVARLVFDVKAERSNRELQQRLHEIFRSSR